MSRNFIIEIIPDEVVATMKGAQAANNFCNNLLSGDLFDNVYSLAPVNFYFINSGANDKIRYFTGNPRRPRVMKILSSIKNNIICAIINRKAETIWFYNLCQANIVCYLILRYLFRVKCFVLLLDYTPDSNILRFQHYYPYFIESSHGVISLSQRVNIKHLNIKFKAGVWNKDKILQFQPLPSKKKLTFLFCGNMGNHTGFPLAIETFSKMIDCELFISGKNPSIEVDYGKYNNIHYLGYMEYDEFMKLYERVDVCLSFRNPSYPENLYNFPSKIIEFFSQNKIVVSTIDYPELEGFKYIKCQYDIDDVILKIEKILSMSLDELNDYRNNQSSLIENFSVESWSNTINVVESNNKK